MVILSCWNHGSSKRTIKLVLHCGNIFAEAVMPHQLSLVVYLADSSRIHFCFQCNAVVPYAQTQVDVTEKPLHRQDYYYYYCYFKFSWLICFLNHSSAEGLGYMGSYTVRFICCSCFHCTSMIIVIVLNPSNPATEPRCPNGACWVLLERRRC